MKTLLALLLLVGSLHAAIPPVATWDSEVHIWARQRVVFQTNTVSDAEYVMATDFMRFLKYTGLRPKIKRCGIYLGSTLESCRAPFIIDVGGTNDVLYAFVAGDYTTTGLTGNGSTKYIATLTTCDWSLIAGLTSMHLASYSRTHSSSAGINLGMSDATYGATHMPILSGGVTYLQMGGVTYAQTSDTNSTGLFLFSRITTSTIGYRNGVSLVSNLISDGLIAPPETLFIHARNANGTADSYSNRQYCFYSIGLGMTDADALAYYRGVQRLQLARGRAM